MDLRSISLKSTKSLLSRWNAEQEPRGHKTGGYLRTCPSLLPFRPRRGANPTQRWRNLSMYVNRGITTVQVYHYKTANARLYEPILRSTMPAQESFMRGPVRGKASWKAADECAQDPHVPQRARTAVTEQATLRTSFLRSSICISVLVPDGRWRQSENP